MSRRLAALFVLAIVLTAASNRLVLAEDAAETEPGAAVEEPTEAEGEQVSSDKTFWGAVKEQLLTLGAGEKLGLLERIVWGVVLIALGWGFYRLIVTALRRAEARMKRLVAVVTPVETRQQQHLSTVLDLVRNIARYAIIVLTAILLLDRVLGVNVVPILTGAGIVGIAVAFGSQSLVRDVVSGVFQLLEGQYAVGDYVQIGTAFGEVEHIGLRITRLRDLQDKLYFIPNGTITMVTTYDDPSLDYVLQVPFSDEAAQGTALQAIEQLARDLRAEFPELVAHIDDPKAVTSESGALSIKMRFGTVPTQDWLVNDEIPARVKQLFTDREIAMPEGRPPRCYLDISPLAKMPRRAEEAE